MKKHDIDVLNNLLNNYSYNNLWVLKGLVESKIEENTPHKITKNFTGERAVDLAIEVYNNNTKLPNLERSVTGTKDFDAYSKSTGKRYSIKGFKGKNTTSSPICAFNNETTEHNFEYVILVKMDNLYQLQEIVEIPLSVALDFKSKNSRDLNFKLSYTKKIKKLDQSTIIYPKTK